MNIRKIKKWLAAFQRRDKGQMEIMGLAIVMVLVILGFLFVVRLRQFEGPSVREQFTETQFASNLLNSVLKTGAPECFNQDLTQLYEDCISRTDAQGNYLGTVQCSNGQSSCAYINSTLQFMFNQTLFDWNRRFEYLACEFDNRLGVDQCAATIHNITNIGCTRLERERKDIPIHTRHGVVRVRLDLC